MKVMCLQVIGFTEQSRATVSVNAIKFGQRNEAMRDEAAWRGVVSQSGKVLVCDVCWRG